MANQMIALNAKAPQSDIFGSAITRNAQMMNMMAQQAAAQRQAARTQQEMQFAANEEARKARLAEPQFAKASNEALSAQVKAADDFLNLTIEGMKVARSPEDAIKIGNWLKSQFPAEMFQQSVDQTLSSLPQDPAAFEGWRKQTLFQSMEAKDQLEQEFTTQNLGTSTRVIAAPKYQGAPGGQGAGVVPGSEAEVAFKPTVINVEGIGGVIVDPNTGKGFPVAAGQTGGFTRPSTGGNVVTGERGGGPVAKALQTNPGALKDGAFARSQPGYAGSSGGFAVFNSPEAGIAAQENLLRNAYVGKGFNTIDKIVNRYAPQGPENSAASVTNYKKYIAQRTGIDINAPISESQIPAVAAAMREFETGNRPGGKPPGAGAPSGKPPKTLEQASQQQAFAKILPIIGYDPKTGQEKVTSLIEQSTSGGAEMLGSEIVGFFGEATPGRKALGQLRAIADNMTFEKLRGKLGAQISDADVRLIANTMASIADGKIPANERAAAWQNVVVPILLRGAGVEVPPQAPAPAARPKPSPSDVAAVRRNRNKKEWVEGFRRQFGDAALRQALGGR